MQKLKKPIVSVLITAYNREKYISFAIQSVLNSTLQDFELIIVDDGSTDNTYTIIQDYSKKDKRIRHCRNEQNLGDYPNRNKAASLAQGKYIKYVDADDYIYPHGLEILVNTMEQFPTAGYGLCSLDQDTKEPFPFMLTPQKAYLRHYFNKPLFHKAPLSAIIKKSAWQDVGQFPENRMVSDSDMWHKLSSRLNVVLMPQGIVWYRDHDEQEVSDIQLNPTYYRIKYEQVVLNSLNNKESPLTPTEKKQIFKRYFISNIRQIIKNILLFRLRDAINLIEHNKSFFIR